ncbi:hypothetical protein TSUD_255650 [Trifolium subterraneum]|uniref:Leucine-rich repeat-containing N-terminal plant-type domain-containing protein n=1 Tax=Trifolium subterraneum TaxID=3900 RepID=A0A2Z6NR51_TRISU|nr:hypothetical protein TSUD_255650 [Trifolium subterraneum]
MKQYQSFMSWLLLCLHLLLFHFPHFSSSSFNFLCHHDQSDALLQFKSSFTLSSNYLGGFQCGNEPYHLKTATWKNGTDCCSWNGVTCDTISGHVVGLNLGCEGIKGEVPLQISHLSKLESLHLSKSIVFIFENGNNFSGPLPKAYFESYEAMMIVPQLGENTNLQYLSMQELRHVEYYDSVAVTTKGIDITLVKIPTIFVIIDLSRNKFEGQIPNVIGKLHALIGLNLSHNRLTGPIPQSIGNLANLEWLDLSSNMFTDEIPAELTNLNFLEVLDVSNNHLVGEIPRGKQFSTFSNDSYEGNLGLCGFPLSKKCGPEPEHHFPMSGNNFVSEEKFGFGWKPVAIGYGCGFVIGIGLGYFVFLIGKPRWLVILFGGQPKRRVNRRRTREMRRTNGLNMNQMVQMS